MALVACIRCGTSKSIRVQYPSTGGDSDDVLRGTLTCKHDVSDNYLGEICNATTVFELVNGAITFYPGPLFQEDLHDGVATEAVEMLSEALLCFYGSSYRGVVVFCRSAAEEALEAQDVPGGTLDTKIKKAGDYLDPEERALANAARITGRNAIHRLAVVSTANALGALTNSIDFLNSISEKEPFPAWQSGRDNSAG